MTPGVYPDMDEATYRDLDAVSCSVLKRFAKVPALAHVARPDTEAMRAGRVIHSAVLEAWSFDARYAATDLDRRGTKAWQEEEAAAAANGKILIKRAEHDSLRRLRDAVHQHPIARDLLAPGLTTETAVVWEDPITGRMCRARMDGIRRDMRLILDVKTTTDAGPWKFARQAADLRMHWQAAWYLDGLAAAPGGFRPEAFVFIAVEKDSPHLIAVYELPAEAIDAGRTQVREALGRYLECEASGVWPGYPEKIETLHLPVWALGDQEEYA